MCVKMRKFSEDWNNSCMAPLYKGKGDWCVCMTGELVCGVSQESWVLAIREPENYDTFLIFQTNLTLPYIT